MRVALVFSKWVLNCLAYPGFVTSNLLVAPFMYEPILLIALDPNAIPISTGRS